MKKLITSEMVMPGHPDKLCDQIADAILTDYVSHDSNARVAVEVAASFKRLLIMGEVTSTYVSDIDTIARDVIRSVGYTKKEYEFTADSVEIIVDINKQSSDIALGVDAKEIRNYELGAGDQGMMFGYATDETESLLPLPYVLSIALAKRLETVRTENILSYLRPDGKMQVTVLYENEVPVSVDTIVLSTQHDEEIDIEVLREDLKREVILKAIPDKWLTDNTKIYINPTGRFVIGGPVGDTGLTGRKIIVDTYGSVVPHGGGSFSGKDYTKVDRTATYYARYVAKNMVAAGFAKRILVGVSYAIGKEEPVSIFVDTFKTGTVSDDTLLEIIKQNFDFRPSHMVDELDMKHLNYQGITNFGHFSHAEASYESLNKVDELKAFQS